MLDLAGKNQMFKELKEGIHKQVREENKWKFRIYM
jgi:hypothetical protein